MPPVNVPTPGGKTILVDLPEGMDFQSPEGRAEAIRRAKSVMAAGSGEGVSIRPPTAPAPQPDAVGRARASLTKEPPLGSKTMFGETDMPGRVVRAAGEMMLPGSWGDLARDVATLPVGGSVITAPLKRTGIGALAGGAADTASKGYSGFTDFAKSVGKHGLVQGVGEILPGALRFGVAQREGKRLLKPYDEAVAARPKAEEARVAGDKAKVAEAKAADEMQGQRIKQGHAALKEARETAHGKAVEQATASHAAETKAWEAEGAGTIMAAWKKHVPSWQSLPDGERGLLEAVGASGQAKLSAAYDQAMRQIARSGKGQDVPISARDAAALGIKVMGEVTARDPREIPMVPVDAAQLASAATGFWKKDHGVYRRVVAALDKAGIGDPAARAEYRDGQALIQFADKSGMLRKGKGTTAIEGFNPDAARAGFTRLKTLDELRKRGMGDMFTGPVAESVRRPRPELTLPAEPRPLGKPLIPPFRAPKPSPETPQPTPPAGVTTRTTPKPGALQGAALAEIPFIVGSVLSGQHSAGSYGYGLPFALGSLAGPAVGGRRIVTNAPRGSMTGYGRLATDVTEGARAVMPQEAEEEARRRRLLR